VVVCSSRFRDGRITAAAPSGMAMTVKEMGLPW
jgi:hypothetical protein